MANTIRIKRSATTATPTGLAQGELAYSEASGTGNGELFIGTAGASQEVIGGQKYIDLVNTGLQDVDFSSNGFMKRTGAGVYAVSTTVSLATEINGNLPVANLNSGTGASGTSFWRGDGVWATPAGSGDVSGAGASTDNAIARWDATTGTILQDSPVTIADTSGNMAGVGTLNGHTIPAGASTLTIATDIAGMIKTTDASVAGWSFIDTDGTFTTPLDTVIPTQLAVKTYVDSVASGGTSYQGGYNAATNTPALDTGSPSINAGDMYTVTVAGTFFTVPVEIGDVLIAAVTSADAAVVGDWSIVERNQVPASTTVAGFVELATLAETDAGTDNVRAVTPQSLNLWTVDGGTF